MRRLAARDEGNLWAPTHESLGGDGPMPKPRGSQAACPSLALVQRHHPQSHTSRKHRPQATNTS